VPSGSIVWAKQLRADNATNPNNFLIITSHARMRALFFPSSVTQTGSGFQLVLARARETSQEKITDRRHMECASGCAVTFFCFPSVTVEETRKDV